MNEQLVRDARLQFLRNVITIALVSGCDWWATIQAHNPETGTVRLTDSDNHWYTVTVATVVNGLNKIKDPQFQIEPNLRKDIWYAQLMNDTDEIGSVASDYIIQAGLFGKLIYTD